MRVDLMAGWRVAQMAVKTAELMDVSWVGSMADWTVDCLAEKMGVQMVDLMAA